MNRLTAPALIPRLLASSTACNAKRTRLIRRSSSASSRPCSSSPHHKKCVIRRECSVNRSKSAGQNWMPPSQTAKRLTRRRNWQRGSRHVQPHTPKPPMTNRREAIGRNPYCFLRRRRRYPRACRYQLLSKSARQHKLSCLGECRVISPAVMSYLAQPNRRPGTEFMKMQQTCH